MKSYKGGFDEKTNAQFAAHKEGEKVRETAEAMIVAAKGDLEAAKNLTEEQIKVALKKKAEMEEKIQQIMNDEELKEKITENVDKFKETLNDLSKIASETAEKSLEEAKAQAEKLNKLRTDAGLTGDAAKAALKQGLNTASDNAQKLQNTLEEKVFNEENKEKLLNVANRGKEEISKGVNAASELGKQKLAEGYNYFLGMTNKKRKRIDGGKRKNKTKKLTKKEKKMKKARK